MALEGRWRTAKREDRESERKVRGKIREGRCEKSRRVEINGESRKRRRRGEVGNAEQQGGGLAGGGAGLVGVGFVLRGVRSWSSPLSGPATWPARDNLDTDNRVHGSTVLSRDESTQHGAEPPLPCAVCRQCADSDPPGRVWLGPWLGLIMCAPRTPAEPGPRRLPWPRPAFKSPALPPPRLHTELHTLAPRVQAPAAMRETGGAT